MKIFVFWVATIVLTGCYRTENGIVFGKPAYETKAITVTKIDLEILERTDELLIVETWTKDSLRTCSEVRKLSLFCALEKASIEIKGNYLHRQAALQEVRFVIDNFYGSYWTKHRLIDFNSNNSTTFSDVKKVIAIAIANVQSKLKRTKTIKPNADKTPD